MTTDDQLERATLKILDRLNYWKEDRITITRLSLSALLRSVAGPQYTATDHEDRVCWAAARATTRGATCPGEGPVVSATREDAAKLAVALLANLAVERLRDTHG